jgi:hypothetical protein
VVPALVAHVQGELELADTDVLMEHSAWSLMDHPVHLDAGSSASPKAAACSRSTWMAAS